jgi:hypothetical protein
MNLEQLKRTCQAPYRLFERRCICSGCKIKKVANSTYIITPYNVDIMGDLIDELENNGLYF